MKNLLFLFVSIMLCSLTIKAQWNQSFTGVRYSRTISVVDDNVVWVSDPASPTIALTTDGGSTWVNKSLPTGMSTNHGVLTAINATTAYIVSNEGGSAKGIYKTTNAGDTWIKQTTGFNENSPFPDFIYFWNANEGVAVGDAYPNQNFEIYTTNNGGDQWNTVPVENMPAGNKGWTYNDRSSAFRVKGDTIYFRADGSVKRIFRSVNRGLNWTEINTPVISSFAFKDKNNGLLSDGSSITSATSKLYTTIDGGQSWTIIDTYGYFGLLDYLLPQDAYFSAGRGLSYSTDNGEIWSIHSSFNNVLLSGFGYSPSGKIFISGDEYVYNSINYTGENLAITNTLIMTSTNIDITFSANVEEESSQNKANYNLYYNSSKSNQNIEVLSASRDNLNNSLVHLITSTDLPVDTINIIVKNVKDNTGFPIINGSSKAASEVVNTGIYTGARSFTDQEIKIFPNPVSDILYITNIPPNSVISIFDVYGNMVINKTTTRDYETLDLSILCTGTHLLKIECSGIVMTKKVIKQ